MEEKLMGLLKTLADALFKGIDRILDEAVEYQNDMGKLKGVYNIAVQDEDGKEGYIKVMLSPVKDKDSIFFVEIKSDLDLKETISGKTYKIDKTSSDSFNQVIEEMLKKNKLSRLGAKEVNSTVDKEVSSVKEILEQLHSADPQNIKIEDDVIQVHVYDPGNERGYTLKLKVDEPDELSIKVDVEGLSGIHYVMDSFRNTKKFDSYEEMQTWLYENIDKFLDDNGIVLFTEKDDSNVNSSVHIELEKITASTGCSIALLSVDNIVDDNTLLSISNNDEFLNSMPEGTSCYTITDSGDDFDIELYEGEVSIDTTFIEMLQSSLSCRSHVESIRWQLDPLYNASLIDRLRDIFFMLTCEAEHFAKLCKINKTDISCSLSYNNLLSNAYIEIADSLSEHCLILKNYLCNLPDDISQVVEHNITVYSELLRDIEISQSN